MVQTKAPFFGEAEPAWDIAQLFPAQGEWSEDEYLALEANRLIEYSHGWIEVLPLPSVVHQLLVRKLFRLLERYLEQEAWGDVLFAPVSVRLWPGKYREPDLVVISSKHPERITPQYLIGGDLVIEIISPDDRNRDTVRKRHEYAQAAIPEYWLVNPEARTITVLVLDGSHYAEHGVFGAESQATSHLLPGFTVGVSALFAEAEL